jgi:hypothetical protein
MARTIEAAALASLALLALAAPRAEAQCVNGEPGCGRVEVAAAAPSPRASAPNSPAERQIMSGGVLALDVLYSPRATMIGGLLTGFYGLSPRFALSLAVGTAGRRAGEAGDHRETPLSAGGILVLTPGAPFRVSVPLRTGVAIHHQSVGDVSHRFAIYTLDAGVSGHFAIHAPVYVGGTIRGQLQVSPWDHQVDFVASFEVDLAVLYPTGAAVSGRR